MLRRVSNVRVSNYAHCFLALIFFRRALYLLVFDLSRPDTLSKIDYWLQTLEVCTYHDAG